MSRWEVLDRNNGKLVVDRDEGGLIGEDPLNEGGWHWPSENVAYPLWDNEVAYNIDTGEVVYR